MDPGIAEVLELIGNVGAPAVAVLLSMKYAINGMRNDVTEIKQDVKDIKSTQAAHTTRIAVLEDRNQRQDIVDAA
jgi:hypothetical protein